MFFEKNYFTDTENFVDKNKRLKQQLAVNMKQFHIQQQNKLKITK